MNYGYAMSGSDSLILEKIDEPDRHWIQLYHHVAGAIDLRGLEVLEVGSGRGGGSSYIQRYLKPARTIGVDLSQQAVLLCRERHRVEGLEFRTGDAERLPLADSAVDVVINVESSHCYPSFDRFLEEVRRILRPGGYFLYTDFRAAEKADSWCHSLRHSGLTLLRETDITANVVSALDLDNERKLGLIQRMVPRPLRASFLDFAAVRGTALFEGFKSGDFTYRSFVLQKTAIKKTLSQRERVG
jgi:SAM-dependent methyltransferase